MSMSDDELYATVHFSVSAGLLPWNDPGEYVHTAMGTALDLNEDEVGSISLKLVSATEAENRGVRLVDVCDADSVTLEAVYGCLFDAQGQANEELEIEPSWHNLLFVEDLETKSNHHEASLRVQLIETAIALFCPAGLIVAEESALELSIDEWRQLGFRRIAESPFVYRDQLKLNPYEQSSAEIAEEASYTCDACGEQIVIPVDLSQGSNQEYVEDCPVCCRANVIHIEIDEEGNAQVWAEPEQDG